MDEVGLPGGERDTVKQKDIGWDKDRLEILERTGEVDTDFDMEINGCL